PIAMIAAAERLFHYGTDTVKEVLFQRGLVTGYGSAVRDHRPGALGLGIGVPVDILLNRQGSSCGERTIDAVAPPFVVGIAIVGVHHRTGAGLEGLLSKKRCGAENEDADEINPEKP